MSVPATKDISIVKTILSHGGDCGCFPCVECPLSQPEGECPREGADDDTLKLAQEWLKKHSPSSIVEVVIAQEGECLGFSCFSCPLEGECELTDASSFSAALKWMEENSPSPRAGVSSWTNNQGEVFHIGDEVTGAASPGIRGRIHCQSHAPDLVVVVLSGDTARGWGKSHSDFPKDLPPEAKCWNVAAECLRKAPAVLSGVEGFRDSLGTPIAIGARILCSDASAASAKAGVEIHTFVGMLPDGRYKEDRDFGWRYCVAVSTPPVEGEGSEFKPGDFVRSEDYPNLRGYIHCMKADGAYIVIRTDGEGWDKSTEALTQDLPEGTKCWKVSAGSLRKAPASDYTSRGVGGSMHAQLLAGGERITLVCLFSYSSSFYYSVF